MLDYVALSWPCKYFHGRKKKSKFFFSFHALSQLPKEGLLNYSAPFLPTAMWHSALWEGKTSTDKAMSGRNTKLRSRLLKRTGSICSPPDSVLSSYVLSGCFLGSPWSERERQGKNCCWTAECVIPARSVEMSPPPRFSWREAYIYSM